MNAVFLHSFHFFRNFRDKKKKREETGYLIIVPLPLNLRPLQRTEVPGFCSLKTDLEEENLWCFGKLKRRKVLEVKDRSLKNV